MKGRRMRYVKLLFSIVLIFLGLIGLLVTFTTPFDLFSLILALVFAIPSLLLARNAWREIKTIRATKPKPDILSNNFNSGQMTAKTTPVVDEKICATEPTIDIPSNNLDEPGQTTAKINPAADKKEYT